MTRHGTLKTTVSALIGSAIFDAQGSLLGRVREFAVLAADPSSGVLGLVLKPSGARKGAQGEMAAIAELQRSPSGLRLLPGASLHPLPQDQELLLLERDLLDQQIIDVHGRKVVRVNDVNLDWEQSLDSTLTLRILEVEVGLRGAARRLLKGL
ncbi:MAG TPA: magnesium transporter, partial [Edaphobacter sp.]